MKFTHPHLGDLAARTIFAVVPVGMLLWILSMILTQGVTFSFVGLGAVLLFVCFCCFIIWLLLSGWLERRTYRISTDGISVTHLNPSSRRQTERVPWREISFIEIKTVSAPKFGISYWLGFTTSKGEHHDLGSFKEDADAQRIKQEIERFRN